MGKIASVPEVTFRGHRSHVEFGRYVHGGGTAIRLRRVDDGAPVAVATINLEDVVLGDDEIVIKDYSENEGMLEVLVDAGIIEDTGRRIQLPYVQVPVCRLTVRGEATA